MWLRNKIFIVAISIIIAGCAKYSSPDHAQWGQYLRGASFTDMTEMSRVAKRPVYLGAGGKLVTADAQNAKKFRCFLRFEKFFVRLAEFMIQ